ncbi:MAG: sorbosone dehydrogenase family protein [Salinimicrobium sp.]
MKSFLRIFIAIFLFSNAVVAFGQTADTNLSEKRKQKLAQQAPDFVETQIGMIELPSPYSSEPTANVSQVIPWPENLKPQAPAGFKVTKYAGDLDHPRISYVAPNNDVFVAETNDGKQSANRITLLRDTNGDMQPDERFVFLENLNQAYGMLVLDGYFYVANVDGLKRFPYKEGQTTINGKGETILPLPAGGYNHHWTRNLIAAKDGSKIYVTVGSASNVGEYGMEKEKRRANIIEINPDGSGEKIYASGLRNPVGMDWNPVTGELWTAVNERDNLGNDLVPDYITSVKEGGFYGWPYSYYGQIKDPRWSHDPHENMVQKAIVPDVPVKSHTASLGLEFYTGEQFPEKFKNGAFVGQHGSWNRKNLSGYKVLFVPFADGKPQQPEEFLTGFMANDSGSEVYGRPVGVTTLPDGSLLVNDDDGNVIWRISAE